MSSEPADQEQIDEAASAADGSSRFLPVIAIGALATIAVAVAFRSEPVIAVLLAAMVGVSTWLSVIDFREHRLPNRIVGPLAAAVLLSVLIGGLVEDDLGRSGRAVAFGLGMAVFLLMANILGGLGMGDVKYGFPMAATVGWFGWDAVSVAVLATTFFAAIVAIGILVRGGGRKQHLAYGPYMALGLVLGLLAAAPS